MTNLANLVKNFRFQGEFIYSEAFGYGHINDTYAVYFKKINEHPRRYILQRINHHVFKEPEKLMENIEHVTSHIREKIIRDGGNPDREVLTIVRTVDDKVFYKDETGYYWRGYIFIDDATSYQSVKFPDLFYHAARAFGRFQKQLKDFPAETLYESIPNFHHTVKRFEAFEEAVRLDKADRAAAVADEIAFAMVRKTEADILVGLLEDGKLPLKVTHNDTKLNNVMIDNRTGLGLCVIDLDTVMPGLALYDFGDSIRYGTNPAAEDEKNLSRVFCDLDLFEQFTKGFLEEAGESLSATEIEYLAFSAKIMTFECGIRFLTDHLNGDTYFKIHKEGHNLDRCRTQFKLVSDMEDKKEKMNAIVQKYSKELYI